MWEYVNFVSWAVLAGGICFSLAVVILEDEIRGIADFVAGSLCD